MNEDERRQQIDMSKFQIIEGYRLEKVDGFDVQYLCLKSSQALEERIKERMEEAIKPPPVASLGLGVEGRMSLLPSRAPLGQSSSSLFHNPGDDAPSQQPLN